MPVFRFDKASGIARDAKKALLNLKDGARLGAGQRASERRKIEKEIPQLRDELRTAKGLMENSVHKKKSVRRGGEISWIDVHKKVWINVHTRERIRTSGDVFWLERELSRLENELAAAKEQRTTSEPEETGALPDFVIIGAQKCGTSSFYHHLVQHSLVERAACKELHFFDALFEEGVDWYRRCFPRPRQKDGHRTITGEATPAYLYHPFVPERMAQVVPRARLIALLRNPVNRAYSQYYQRVRKGRETRSFEEVIEAEERWLLDKEDEVSENEHRASADYERRSVLARGIYVDQLMHWSRFFSDEQLLVTTSEDFFGRPQETLKVVLNFLELPEWEPEAWEVRNKGDYQQEMDPKTRRLEAFFEPHNKRLYEYLGVDFGW